MASKYLSSGTPTFAKATRIIAGATMSADFSADDATFQRSVVFRDASNVYYGRVLNFISATSIKLMDSGVLPSSNATLVSIELLDLGEQYSRQDYLNEMESLVKPEANKLSATDKDRILDRAVYVYTSHSELELAKRIDGANTNSYLLSSILGSLWSYGHTTIERIEYPSGEDEPSMLDAEDYEIYDDGTAQDGSNLVLRFKNSIAPTSSEKFILTFDLQRNIPLVGSQNFPYSKSDFTAITTLAASIFCAALASAYAQSIETQITADSVNYNEKTRKYLDLARYYMSIYKGIVFGDEESTKDTKPVMKDIDIDLTNALGGSFAFHSSRNK